MVINSIPVADIVLNNGGMQMDKELTLEEIEILQEKHRQQLKENAERIDKKKKRVSRLVRRGIIAESYIEDAENMTDEEFEAILHTALKPSKVAHTEPSQSTFRHDFKRDV